MGTEAFKKIGFRNSHFKGLPRVARKPISYISYIYKLYSSEAAHYVQPQALKAHLLRRSKAKSR